MSRLLVIGIALLAAAIGSEMRLRGTKLQTGLGRVLVVWVLVYVIALAVLVGWASGSWFAFTIFWGGAFLSWFGVRSHIESSILLRMLHLLGHGRMAEAELIAAYLGLAGHAARTEELLRGGLATKVEGQLVVTSKGKTILAVVAKLR